MIRFDISIIKSPLSTSREVSAIRQRTDGRRHDASAANPSMAEAKTRNHLHASFPTDLCDQSRV